MKLRVQIVEDDPFTAHDLKEILIRNQFEVIGISNSYHDALQLFHSGKPDLLLADIGLKGEKDGVELVKEINSLCSHCPVVYLTANSDSHTKSRAFDTNPAGFLAKPFNSTTVVVTLELAFDRFNKELTEAKGLDSRRLFVKKGDQFSIVSTSDILYIQAEGSYSKIITEKGDYLLSGNLKSYSMRFKEFLRTHRSYLINQEKITAIENQKIHLGNRCIPIGRRFRKEVMEQAKRFP